MKLRTWHRKAIRRFGGGGKVLRKTAGASRRAARKVNETAAGIRTANGLAGADAVAVALIARWDGP